MRAVGDTDAAKARAPLSQLNHSFGNTFSFFGAYADHGHHGDQHDNLIGCDISKMIVGTSMLESSMLSRC